MQNTTRTGSVGEVKAVAWLLEQGYEVFKNVCHTGPADLVIWKPGEDCVLVDVKVVRPYKKQDGSASCLLTGHQRAKKLGVRLLLYDIEGDRFWWPEEFEQEQERQRREHDRLWREENKRRFAQRSRPRPAISAQSTSPG